LKTCVTTYNPASLIDLLGTEQYDSWWAQLIDLHMVFNFAFKYFWCEPWTQAPVPCNTWYRYRAHVFETTTELFPRSSEFATPVARHTASQQFSTPEARTPPAYTRVSPTVHHAQYQRRAARNRDSNRPRDHSRTSERIRRTSYHSSSPNMHDGTPIARSVASVSFKNGGDDMHPITPENTLQRDRTRYWDRDSNSASSQHLGKDGHHFESDSLDDRSYQTADSFHSNKSGSKGGSRRSRSRLEPWNRPAKARSKFNEKITWNGTRASFREYRKAIEGHLLQADAGYLIDPDFLMAYEVHKADQQHMEYLKSDKFWSKHEVPFAQARSDKQYLYGMLVSSSRQTDNKVILTNKKDLDGIMAWIQMTRIYDNGGSIDLRISAIDDDVRKPYSMNFPGGLTGYIEQYQALMAELDTIAPFEYTDDRKQNF
jgi:hypothetical protein